MEREGALILFFSVIELYTLYIAKYIWNLKAITSLSRGRNCNQFFVLFMFLPVSLICIFIYTDIIKSYLAKRNNYNITVLKIYHKRPKSIRFITMWNTEYVQWSRVIRIFPKQVISLFYIFLHCKSKYSLFSKISKDIGNLTNSIQTAGCSVCLAQGSWTTPKDLEDHRRMQKWMMAEYFLWLR